VIIKSGRRNSKLNKKGFTLVELMIVMVIISLLASVAIPKFGDLAKAAKQAAAKHNLGVLKSATSIYYSSNNGYWPYQDAALAHTTYSLVVGDGHGTYDDNAWVPTYMSEIPKFDAGVFYPTNGTRDIIIGDNNPGGFPNYDTREPSGTAGAAWVFIRDKGVWYINCNATDTQGTGIHTW